MSPLVINAVILTYRNGRAELPPVDDRMNAVKGPRKRREWYYAWQGRERHEPAAHFVSARAMQQGAERRKKLT